MNVHDINKETNNNPGEVKLTMDIDYLKLANCVARAVAGVVPEPPMRTPGTIEMPELMTFQQAKEYLQISDNSLRALLEARRISYTKICSRYRISTESIIEYLDALEVKREN